MTCVRNQDRLVQALRLIADLPPLSATVRHLLATLYTPTDNVSLTELATWIEKDTLTAGKVLGLANSAYYGRTEPILSVRHAVSRLGVNPIRSLVTSMSMMRYWNSIPTPAEWSTSRFNAHSIAVAVLSDIMASTIRCGDAQTAFLAGLFHDIGHVGIATLLHQGGDRQKLILHKHPHLEELERELLGFSHSELSATIVCTWHLPQVIETAVRFHEVEPDWERIKRGDVWLSDIVHLADAYADCEGHSISGLSSKNRDELPTLDQLGLTEQTTIFARFHQELENLLSVI